VAAAGAIAGDRDVKPLRILLADDHGVVRKGLKFLLESEPDLGVVGEASDGRQAVDLADQLQPDVVVMDIAMPRLNGIDATAQIIKRYPAIAVIILSMYSDEEYLVRTLTAGARGYLLKDSAEADLVQAVRMVAEGKPFFSPSIASTLLEDYVRRLQQRGQTDSYELLTDREKEVLHLLAEGKTNKEIATLFSLSPYTVETHRTRIMQKLGLHNTAEIVLYAVRKKIIA
jgi:DNA-binding NarL/FixJ family response regulator